LPPNRFPIEEPVIAKRRSKSTDGNDAIAMLMEDHKRVQKLFREFEQVDRDDPEACREIVEMACAELKIHATLEEEIFYPGVREALDEDDEPLLDEAEIEHDTATNLIEPLEGLQPDDPYYGPTFTVLSEYVKHHLKEEEGEMFPKVKKAKLDLGELGARMRARKEELMGGIETPGQLEPSAEAEGVNEPSAARALRQSRREER
jgi:hemerythrin superfamily protein